MVKLQKLSFEDFGPYRLIGHSFSTTPLSPDIAREWQRFFADDRYLPLGELARQAPYQTPLPDAYIGMVHDEKPDGSFTYTIGILFAADTPAPTGMDTVDLSAGPIAWAWVQGAERAVYAEGPPVIAQQVEAQGYALRREGFWCCEVYTMERFEKAKQDGEQEIVLDYYLPVHRQQ